MRADSEDAAPVRVCGAFAAGADCSLLTLPFALVERFGWSTVLNVLLVSYTFFGIEEIGAEINGPFREDANHLPRQRFARKCGITCMHLRG